MQSSVIKFMAMLLVPLASVGCQTVGPLLINGQAVFEGGKPVTKGTIVITEMHGRPFMMPAVTQQMTTKTDNSGNFLATIKYMGGFISIRLNPVSCKYGSASVTLYEEQLAGVSTVTPRLVVTRHSFIPCNRHSQ